MVHVHVEHLEAVIGGRFDVRVHGSPQRITGGSPHAQRGSRYVPGENWLGIHSRFATRPAPRNDGTRASCSRRPAGAQGERMLSRRVSGESG